MPRTKRPNKKSVKLPDVDGNANNKSDKFIVYFKDVDKHFARQMAKLHASGVEKIGYMRRANEIAKVKISSTLGNKPLKYLVADDLINIGEVSSTCVTPDNEPEQARKPASPAPSKRATRNRSLSRDGQAEAPSTSRATRARSQSRDNNMLAPPQHAGQSARGKDKGLMVPPTALPNRFRTPNVNIAPGGTHYNTITPKVQPNCPVSILRRPQEGEMAFAMTGSPLLVSSSHGANQMANVNFPLSDGRIMSILPQLGLRPHDMPAVDDETMRQLLRLRENLNSILENKNRL